MKLIGGPLDGEEIENDIPKDKCLCARKLVMTDGVSEVPMDQVAFYWRDGDVLKFIRTITTEQYKERFGDESYQRL